MEVWPAIAVWSSPGSPLAWESFCAACIDSGAVGVHESEPDERTPSTRNYAVVYFGSTEVDRVPDEPPSDEVVRAAAERWLGKAGWRMEASWLTEADWAGAFRPHFHLVQASRRVFVGPPEDCELPADAPADAVLVILDDVRPFGAGTHPSTRICLDFLEEEAGRSSSLLDFGSGTGILAIAAVRLGMDFALAVDNDINSASAIGENVELNGLVDRIDFVAGSTVAEAKAGALLAGRPLPDVIACNMLSTEFDPLLGDLARLRRPMVLSGFLAAEWESVRQRLAGTGWEVERVAWHGEWGGCRCRSVRGAG